MTDRKVELNEGNLSENMSDWVEVLVDGTELYQAFTEIVSPVNRHGLEPWLQDRSDSKIFIHEATRIDYNAPNDDVIISERSVTPVEMKQLEADIYGLLIR